MINMMQGDCMELMRSKPDNYYDLAIVDPPYGIGEDGLKNHSRSNKAKSTYYTPKDWDSQSPNLDYFKELTRVSKNKIVWGANHFLSKIPYDSSCWIVWDKDNGNNDFADCELAYTSFKSAVRKFKFRWNGMLQEDMRNKEIRIHPTQKPVALYKWLLTNYAKEGDKILDTHGGSGSICIACHDLKYDLDWIELDEEYYQLAKKRYDDHASQLQIF